jgi:hypothetical protein
VQAALGAGLHLRRDVLAPVAAHLPGALEALRGQLQPDGLDAWHNTGCSDIRAQVHAASS